MTYTVPTRATLTKPQPHREQVLACFTLIILALAILFATLALIGGLGSLSSMNVATVRVNLGLQCFILLLLDKGRHRAPTWLVAIAVVTTSLATLVALVLPVESLIGTSPITLTRGPGPFVVEVLQMVAVVSAHAVLIAQYRGVALGWVRPVYWITTIAALIFGILGLAVLANPHALNQAIYATCIVALAVTLLGTTALMLSRSVAGTAVRPAAALSVAPPPAPPLPPIASVPARNGDPA